jgi:enoyl-CoA hydratase
MTAARRGVPGESGVVGETRRYAATSPPAPCSIGFGRLPAAMVDELRYERVGAAAVLTIDRPARRNAIDAAAAEAFRRGLTDFEADDGARVLVLTGAGGEAFCAGADLKAMNLDVSHPDGPMGPTRLTPAKPAIAAVDGWCLAGGVELSLWCDMRIATPQSTFGLFERRWGVPLLDGGTQRLPRVVGMGRALELILTGRPVKADEAKEIGLVNELVEPGRHLDRALELAERIASFPQETMLADRRAAIEGFGKPLADGLALEAKLGNQVLDVAVKGAARFASGEGRHGRFPD